MIAINNNRGAAEKAARLEDRVASLEGELREAQFICYSNVCVYIYIYIYIL